MSVFDEPVTPSYVPPPEAYEQVSFWRVFCGAGCGSYLAGEPGAWTLSQGPGDGARFASEGEAWQAANGAGWAGVVPEHAPHTHGPYGPHLHRFRCSGNGASDCDLARSYKEATVCPPCRAKGWRP